LADNATVGVYTSKILSDQWKNLITELPEPSNETRFKAIVQRLCTESDLVAVTLASGFDLENAQFYLTIGECCPSAAFKQWNQRGIDSLGSRAWQAELNDYGYALRLTLALGLTLKTSFQDAVVEFAKQVAAGSVTPRPELLSAWPRVVAALDSTSVAALRVRLVQDAIPQDGECADSFFELFGEDIKEPVRREKGTLARLLPPLIRGRRESGLRWLQAMLEANRKLLDFESELVQDFRGRVQSEISNSDANDEAHVLTISIAEILGITPDAPPAENDPTG
jgi:hypothetical protein